MRGSPKTPRLLEIRLEKRNVACVGPLLDRDARLTCDIVWDPLPQGGDAGHAKYAINEVDCPVPPIQGDAPGLENSTIAPIPGDVVHFDFLRSHLARTMREERGLDHLPGIGPRSLLRQERRPVQPGHCFRGRERLCDNRGKFRGLCRGLPRRVAKRQRGRAAKLSARVTSST